jgi:SAM-dependent methyltransferase
LVRYNSAAFCKRWSACRADLGLVVTIFTIVRRFSVFIKELSTNYALQRARHDYENVFLKSKRDITTLMQCPLDKVSILVFGCGYTYPDVVLFSSAAHCVAGVDIKDVFYRDGMKKLFRSIYERNGSVVFAFLKAALRRYRDKKYVHSLEKISGVRIDHQRYNVLSYDGHHLPFKEQTFDVVISNAVLEYVEDLEPIFKELHRITKEHGISYHLWLNFYSFYGGHVSKHVSQKDPWGHLRNKYKTRDLNKFTPSVMQNYFSKYFDVLALYHLDKNHNKRGIDTAFRFEREELLSESIKDELRSFPRDLLLTRTFLIIGRKKEKR